MGVVGSESSIRAHTRAHPRSTLRLAVAAPQGRHVPARAHRHGFGLARLLGCRFRFMSTCCGIQPATHWRPGEWTHDGSSTSSGMRRSRTPCATRRCRQSRSRTSGADFSAQAGLRSWDVRFLTWQPQARFTAFAAARLSADPASLQIRLLWLTAARAA